MDLTIILPQELEKRLREQSVRAGLDAANFALLAIEEKLRQEIDSDEAAPTSEVELLERINLGIPEPTWREYHSLIEKRDDESLSTSEHTRLLEISDQVERANVRRLSALYQLSLLRGTTLADLMKQLGIRPLSHG